jgi:hypothetical protein
MLQVTPTCCGRRSTSYHRSHGWTVHGESLEEGFRCKRCGSIRLYFPVDGSTYNASVDAIRLSGIQFDQSLSDTPVITRQTPKALPQPKTRRVSLLTLTLIASALSNIDNHHPDS